MNSKHRDGLIKKKWAGKNLKKKGKNVAIKSVAELDESLINDSSSLNGKPILASS